MGSNPIIGTLANALLRGKFVRICDLAGCEQSRTKTHEKTVYSSTIRQVPGGEGIFLRGVFFPRRWVSVLSLVLTRIAISRIRARCLFCVWKCVDFNNGSLSAFLGALDRKRDQIVVAKVKGVQVANG
jgi:hypothetical protein